MFLGMLRDMFCVMYFNVSKYDCFVVPGGVNNYGKNATTLRTKQRLGSTLLTVTSHIGVVS